MASFGGYVRQLRQRRGLSQPEVADKAGIDVTYLSKIENDRVSPPAESVIERLAECLGGDHEQLLLLGNKVPSTYRERIQKDRLVADFMRKASDLNQSQRQRIKRIIHETQRG